MQSRKDFEARMVKLYPLLYADMYGDSRQTLMAFGFAIGPGWYPIVENLSSRLEDKIRQIYDDIKDDPKQCCDFCGHRKKWHWFHYLTNSFIYFFMNKWKAIKMLPREIKRYHNFKMSRWKAVRNCLKNLKWHRACRRFQYSYPRAVQVKEKFGGLRFYMTHYSKDLEELISDAEKKSYETCENCGEPGKERTGGWIHTLCDKCHKERQRKRKVY